ncbi:hypothetical protein KM043_008317 [Ampulex compressa]|nr:hypothetical protein KM043_008317 [Ampulex compressa]
MADRNTLSSFDSNLDYCTQILLTLRPSNDREGEVNLRDNCTSLRSNVFNTCRKAQKPRIEALELQGSSTDRRMETWACGRPTTEFEKTQKRCELLSQARLGRNTWVDFAGGALRCLYRMTGGAFYSGYALLVAVLSVNPALHPNRGETRMTSASVPGVRQSGMRVARIFPGGSGRNSSVVVCGT